VRRSLSVPLAIAAAIACLAIGPATIAQTKLTTLRVATIPTDIGAEIYYARDLGLFQKAGFDVEITPIQSGSAITAAVVSNAVDIGYSNLVSLSVAHEKGINFTVLGLANMHAPRAVTAGILVVARSSPIRSAKDLAGKTVAVNALGSLPELGIRAWMERNGADPSQVKFVEFPFSALREAVTSGRVDAGALEATNSQGIDTPGSDVRRLANVYDAIAPRFTPSAWFATTDWVTAHPADAKAFTAILYQTAKWANANHEASAAILANYVNKSAPEIQTATRVEYATSTTTDYIQPVIDLAAHYGQLKAAFPAASLLGTPPAGR